MTTIHTRIKEVAREEVWSSLSFPALEKAAQHTVSWISHEVSALTPREDLEALNHLHELFIKTLPETSSSIQTLSKITRYLTVQDRCSFDAVTRYLPQQEKTQCASRDLKNVKSLSADLTEGAWEKITTHYITHLDDLPRDALKAFEQQLISYTQFSTLLFLWSLMTEFPNTAIEVCPLFQKEGKVHPFAERAISSTLYRKGQGLLASSMSPFLGEKELQDFFEAMEMQPFSERFFFILSSRRSSIKPFTVTSQIQDVGINIFNEFTTKEDPFLTHRMIPSFSMMQQFLAAYSEEESPLYITPVIGLSSVEDIERNGREFSRDMALCFPGVDLPKEADLLPAPTYTDFREHDFYHSIVASKIPKKIQQAFIFLAQQAQALQKEQKEKPAEQFFAELYERLIDMEHTVFSVIHYPAKELYFLSLGQKFLIALEMCMHDAYGRIARKQKRNPIFDNPEFQRQMNRHVANLLTQDNFYLRASISLEDVSSLCALEQQRWEIAKNKFDLFKKMPNLFVKEVTKAVVFDGKLMPRIEAEMLEAQRHAENSLAAALLHGIRSLS